MTSRKGKTLSVTYTTAYDPMSGMCLVTQWTNDVQTGRIINPAFALANPAQVAGETYALAQAFLTWNEQQGTPLPYVNILPYGGSLSFPQNYPAVPAIMQPCAFMQTSPPSGALRGKGVLLNGAGASGTAFSGQGNCIASCYADYLNDFEAGAGGISLGNGVLSTAHAHGGTTSLQVNTVSAVPTVTLSDLAPNTSYAVHLYVYGTAAVTSTGGSVNLNITTASPGAWAKVSGTFTTDGSGNPVTMTFGYPGSMVYYDDVLIQRADITVFWPDLTSGWCFISLFAGQRVSVSGTPDRPFLFDGTALVPVVTSIRNIAFPFGNGGNTLNPGPLYVGVAIDYACTITGATVASIDCTTSSATFDIWRANGAVPTVANSIIGTGTKPTLTSGTYAKETSFTDWASNTLAAGDILIVSLATVSAAKFLTLTLELQVS